MGRGARRIARRVTARPPWWLQLALPVLAACGGGGVIEPGRTATTTGGEEDVPAGAPTTSDQAQGTTGRIEPTVQVREAPSDPAAAPRDDVPGRYYLVDVPPGAALHPPATACQDVLLFVRGGTLVASGTGIAERAAPLTLYAGDAVRFGPEADGDVRNDGDTAARTVLVVARDEGAGPIASDPGIAMPLAPVGDAARCPVAPPSGDARVAATRVAHVDTTTPLTAAGGKMRVRILLDAQGQGALRGALSWLDGDADVAVPLHRHESSAELLLVEDGDGSMHVGEHDVHVTAGSAIYVPKGVMHDFRGAGTRPLHAIQVYTPSGPEQRFRPLTQP